MIADGHVEFPPQGLVLRGSSVNSVAMWIVGILAVVVLLSDVVVAMQWLLTGMPASPLFVFAGVVLALSTLLLAVTVLLTRHGVRRQRYGLSTAGLRVRRWRWRVVPWTDIRAISRRYQKAPGGSTMGVAVYVSEPERFAGGRDATRHLREYGTPIYLDLTDVTGGTVRFFAAARWYSHQAGRNEVLFD